MWATGRCLRGLGWAGLLAVLATGCFDEADGDNERDTNDTEVSFSDAGDMETGPLDAGDMEPEVDADLRPCRPGDDGGPCTVGVGACEMMGRKICVNGMYVCDAQPGEPKEEQCNGVDDDCDGRVDEMLDRRCYADDANGTAGVGRCAAGVETCAAGEWGACEGQILPGDETCDGVDEDCDGEIDEIEPRRCYDDDANGTEGVGLCAAGLQACAAGAWAPCEGQVLPTDETCDGADQDCDGTVDELAPRRCYDDDENGTDGVGRCTAGQEACVDGAWGACAGQVLPAPETCDGVDEDCDGRVDIGLDPDAAGELIGACGELVADHCRLWLSWTSLEVIDPGEDMSRAFDQWVGCIDVEESIEGRGRCTNTFFDREIHVLPMPEGELLGVDHKVGVRWHCPGDDAPDEVEDLLDRIAGECMVTLGERYTPGELVGDEWQPCDSEGMTLWGVGERYRCTTTHPRARWRAVTFGRLFGLGTAMSMAFRCLSDDPVLRSVEAQTEVWFGWAPRAAGEPADTPPDWAQCEGPDPGAVDAYRCTSTAGDGRFHAIDLDLAQEEEWDPGRFGISLRPGVIGEGQ